MGRPHWNTRRDANQRAKEVAKEVAVSVVSFFVPGQPKPKARPRLNRKTSAIYTPRTTKAWEEAVGWGFKETGEQMLVGDIDVTLRFYRSTRRRVDLDNLVKAVLDGLNGVAYDDDAQVVRLHAYLHLGEDDPGVGVWLEEIPNGSE